MSISLTLLKGLNSVIRFGLELCALAALVYWGFKTTDNIALELVLGLGSPIAFAAIWGMFIAPKAISRLQDPLRLLVEIVLFVGVAAALLSIGSTGLAMAFGVTVAANLVLLVVLGQRGSV